MRTLALAILILGVLGCRDERELPTEPRRPYAPPEAGPGRTVEVRNSCPEAVVVAVGVEPPSATTPTTTLASTRVAKLSVAPGERIWLRYDGRYELERSVAPRGPVEVGYQCKGIFAQGGGR